jgi:hypothetical protein
MIITAVGFSFVDELTKLEKLLTSSFLETNWIFTTFHKKIRIRGSHIPTKQFWLNRSFIDRKGSANIYTLCK